MKQFNLSKVRGKNSTIIVRKIIYVPSLPKLKSFKRHNVNYKGEGVCFFLSSLHFRSKNNVICFSTIIKKQNNYRVATLLRKDNSSVKDKVIFYHISSAKNSLKSPKSTPPPPSSILPIFIPPTIRNGFHKEDMVEWVCKLYLTNYREG